MSYPFYQQVVEKFMNDNDINKVADMMIQYVVAKARENNHVLNYEEIVKVMNAFWYRKNIRDTIIQGIYAACHSGNNN
jgi:hypothetical protein